MAVLTYQIFGCFEFRTPSFLAQEEWQKVPFQIYPASPIQALLNHAALIPALLERFDILMRCSLATGQHAAYGISWSFGNVLKQLDQWEQSYRLTIQGSPYWPTPPQPASHCFSKDISQESLWFPDLFVANAFTHLWALQVVCIMHCQRLEIQFPELSIEGLSMEPGPWNQLVGQSTHKLATRICQSMEFLLQDEGRLYAEASTLFPLRVAYMIFSQDSIRHQKLLDWCRTIVDHLVFKGVKLTSLL